MDAQWTSIGKSGCKDIQRNEMSHFLFKTSFLHILLAKLIGCCSSLSNSMGAISIFVQCVRVKTNLGGMGPQSIVQQLMKMFLWLYGLVTSSPPFPDHEPLIWCGQETGLLYCGNISQFLQFTLLQSSPESVWIRSMERLANKSFSLQMRLSLSWHSDFMSYLDDIKVLKSKDAKAIFYLLL